MKRGYELWGFVWSTVIVCLTLLVPEAAQAHVKWFCAYDVAGQPLGLENVLCPDFEELVGFSISLLLFGCLVERTALGAALSSALDSVTGIIERNIELIVRCTAGGFFVCLWAKLHVFLTPELTTDMAIVPWIQLGIALSLLTRRTMPLAGAGIVLLFGLATWQYGVFHLMDYPIFLGIAAYLIIVGLNKPLTVRPLDVLRWAAGITLMWASVEKWAYPQWSYPMFVSHPDVSFGLDVGFFMRSAGVVEFALAFALVWTPLVRRMAALILAGMFIAAIGEFGPIDAIGHSCIIAVLLAIMSDSRREVSTRRSVVVMPFTYSGALAIFLTGYYGMHTLMFGTSFG